MEKNACVVISTPRKWGLEDIHGFHGKKMLKCFVPCFSLSNFQGKRFVGKKTLVKNWDFVV